MKALIVVDMQNDFIDGALGTTEACAIVPAVEQKVREFDGPVLFTRDTHPENYLDTQEGRNLPVVHCIKGSFGWEICPTLDILCKEGNCPVFDKPTFGSTELAAYLAKLAGEQPLEEIELCGVCTDICVISNALLIKASLPEVSICVDASCCAGVTPSSHANALAAMKMCQILVKGEEE